MTNDARRRILLRIGAIALVLATTAAVAGIAVFVDRTRAIPDVRQAAMGYVSPEQAADYLVDAGFCVRFRIDISIPGPGQPFNTIADAVSIRDEFPNPGHWWSRAAPGSTVTITLWGSNLGGPPVDYEAMSRCPAGAPIEASDRTARTSRALGHGCGPVMLRVEPDGGAGSTARRWARPSVGCFRVASEPTMDGLAG